MIATDKLTESTEPTGGGRRQHTPLSAGGWAMASYIISYAIGAVIFIPLAWVLAAEDFGLYTEATVFYSAVTIAIEMPLINAVVRATDRQRAANAIFSLSIVLGLSGMVVCALLGFPMSGIYRTSEIFPATRTVAAQLYNVKVPPLPTSQDLIPMMFLMALAVLTTSLGTVPTAILSRNLDFRRKVLPDTISLAAGAGVAMVAALLGAGLYSLGLYVVVRATTNAGVAWLVAGWRPARLWSGWREILPYLPFVSTNSVGELTLTFRFNVDYAIGGAILGANGLGIYTLAWDSADKPAKIVNAFFDRPGFASFARLQDNMIHLRRIFLSATRLLSAVTLPVFLGVLFLREDAVSVALPARLQAVAGPMLPLFMLQALWIIFHPSAGVVLALGHSRVYAMVNSLSLAGTVVAVIIGSEAGVNGLAWAMLVSSGLTSLAWGLLALFYTRPTRAELWQAVSIPLALTITTVPAIALADFGLRLVHLPVIVRLAVTVVIGGVVFLFVGWRCLPALRRDLTTLHQAIPE